MRGRIRNKEDACKRNTLKAPSNLILLLMAVI